MKKSFRIGGDEFDVWVRINPRGKRVRISVRSDGRIILSRPRYVSNRFITRLLRENHSWIVKHSQNLKEKEPVPGDYQQDKKKAKEIIRDRLEYFQNIYSLKYNKLSVRNQKTRWGSCSKQGNLSFNYRLLYLPERLRDYIIVHELCHLVEFNHSKSFWALVAQVIPEHQKMRKELRKKPL